MKAFRFLDYGMHRVLALLQGNDNADSESKDNDGADAVHEDDAIWAYISKEGIVTPAKAAFTPASGYPSLVQKTRQDQGPLSLLEIMSDSMSTLGALQPLSCVFSSLDMPLCLRPVNES